jgi:hypothetical protein
MNIYGNYEATRAQGGFTANRFSTPGMNQTSEIPFTYPGVSQQSDPYPAPEHWTLTAGKSLLAAPLDVIDTFSSSVGLTQRGEINTGVYGSVGMSNFGRWVEANKGSVEATSGLLGAITVSAATELAVSKLVGSAWFAATGLGKVAAPIIQSVDRAEVAAANASMDAATKGTSLGIWSADNLKFVTTKALVYGAKGATSEVAVAATMNKNSAIWSDDMSQNLLFGALGIAIPGGAGAISARGAIYRWANSDAMKFVRAEVADPGNYQRLRQAIPINALSGNPIQTFKPSAEITAEALDIRRDDMLAKPGATPPTQTDTRRAIQSESNNSLRDKLQNWTRKGITGNAAATKFNVTNQAGSASSHVLQALHDDPALVFGASEIGALPAGKTGVNIADDYAQLAQDKLASNDPKIQAEGRLMEQRQALVLVNKTWMTPDEAKPFNEFTPNPESYKMNGIGQMTFTGAGSGRRYIISEDGRVNHPAYTSLPIPDILGIHEGMSRLMNAMKAKAQLITIPKNADFWQLDFALEYVNRGGNVDFTALGKGAGAEEAQLQSLKLKAAQLRSAKSIGVNERFIYNLPAQTASERVVDPKGYILKNWLQGANRTGMTISTMADWRQKMQNTFGLMMDVKTSDRLDANIWGFNRDMGSPNGKWMQHVVGFFDDTPGAKWSKFELADQIQETKTAKIQTLASKRNAPVTKLLTQTIMQHPLLKQAMEVVGLDSSQIAGLSNAVTASASQLLTQAMRFRNSPTMQAAQDIRRVVNRITEQTLDSIYTDLKPITEKLNAVSAAKSRVLFNQYYSHAAGWEIAGTQTLPDGMVGYLLRRDSDLNVQRLGRGVKSGELLTSEVTGKPIVMDSLGESLRVGLERHMTALLRERNAVREARGLSPLEKKDFFVAPRSTTGKFVGFTLDENNKPVPGGAIVANTEAEYRSASEKLRETWAKQHPEYRVLSEAEIRSFNDLWDQAGLDFIDPTHMAAPSGTQKGTLASREINPNAIADALDYIKKGYEQNANGTVRTIFDSQLSMTKMRNAAGAATHTAVPGTKSIWQVYDETLMGIPADVNPSKGTLMSAAKGLDETINHVISVAWPAAQIPGEAMKGLLGVLGYSAGKIRGKPVNLTRIHSFDELAAELGPHMPFAQSMDYAKYTHGISIPPTMKGIARGLNRIGAGVLLRWFEIPQAAMNMTGIITNMPGLVGNGRVPIMGKVGGVGVIDSMKIMAKGAARMLSDRSSGDWLTMVKNGDSAQDFAEWNMRLALIKDRGTFSKVMLGNPAGKTFLEKKGVDGIASYLTDSTENMSRVWAHFIGLELADYHGVVGLEARHHFARQIANDAIANYDPLNRPELFNSGVGSMYGLFLSYAQNYYQRLFRWMEHDDYAAVGKSLATQAAMFGITGVPGWNQMAALRDFVTGNEGTDGHGMLDGIYSRYGSAVGSVVAHGGFDQVINLLSFGHLPAVAFHTRGDQNFRHPAGDFLTSAGKVPTPPGLEVLKDIITGVFGVADQMINHRDTTTSKYMAEIMARTMPNRMLHGALTVLVAGGQDADVNGNLMAETKDVAESMYRFLGLRSGRQQAEIDAYFLNQKALQVDATRLDKVRQTTRAAVRAGNYDSLPAIFQSYLDAGGKPWNYSNWLHGIVEEASQTRAQNQLLKSLRSPAHQELARRIELFTGGQ